MDLLCHRSDRKPRADRGDVGVAVRLIYMTRELCPAFRGFSADGPTALGEEEDPRRAFAGTGGPPSGPAHGHRTPPGPEYDMQIERAQEIVHAHRIPVFRAPGLEADDFFGALVLRLLALELRVVIVSKDHDPWQLARKGVAIWDGDFGHELTDVRDVERRYRVPPGWLAATLALAGNEDEAPALLRSAWSERPRSSRGIARATVRRSTPPALLNACSQPFKGRRQPS